MVTAVCFLRGEIKEGCTTFAFFGCLFRRLIRCVLAVEVCFRSEANEWSFMEPSDGVRQGVWRA